MARARQEYVLGVAGRLCRVARLGQFGGAQGNPFLQLEAGMLKLVGELLAQTVVGADEQSRRCRAEHLAAP